MEASYGIFINGSYGVGKTTVLDHVGNLLAAEGRAFSLIDIDWFHRSSPVAAFDPRNQIIEARNIAAVWANYQTAGPRQLVMSGVIAEVADKRRYSEAVALPLRSVRLTAQPPTIEERLRARYDASRQVELRWHLDRWKQLSERLTEANPDEVAIATDGLSSSSVASLIARHFGLVDASR
ncbi:hypothetical protein QUG98_16215 [Curtobacterium sp. RHCJP20]|uniref:Shikimate kinase n=1 Tax=Curtobacterium subtropicum TaxID=3055138 RepID=A0ABT7TK85_9MICO|nr:hypothetical protein [Curtobacterium subtropicum]MDM7889998.1 hypothetical protein [Curtobacterium subtropicum]